MSLEEYSKILPDMFEQPVPASSATLRPEGLPADRRVDGSAVDETDPAARPRESEPDREGVAKKGLADIVELQTNNHDGGYDVEIIPTNRFVSKRAKAVLKTSKYDDYVLVLRRTALRRRDQSLTMVRVELEVYSRPLCHALRDMMRNLYDGISLQTYPVKFRLPFHELFFYRNEIRSLADNDDTESGLRKDAKILHDFISNNGLLSGVVDDHEKYSPHGQVAGDILWTIFPPNSLAVLDNKEVKECWVVRKVVQQPTPEGVYLWVVTGLCLWCDGWNLGMLKRICVVAPVTMEVNAINEFPLIPVTSFQGWDALKCILERRSIKLREVLGGDLTSFAPQRYKGNGWNKAPDLEPIMFGTSTIADAQVDERIIVDYKEYYRRHRDPEDLRDLRQKHHSPVTARGMVAKDPEDPDSSSNLDAANENMHFAEDLTPPRDDLQNLLESRPIIEASRERSGTPSDTAPADEGLVTELDMLAERARNMFNISGEDFELLFPALVPSFGLKTKRWCWVLADKLEKIEWNRKAYDSLQYDQRTKDLVSALIKGHKRGLEIAFDDLIEGKGQGLVFLLHGEPGLGKTLTAESVADYLEQPLYTISGGEIGSDVSNAEQRLDAIFDLAKRWDAVTLLDEADVLLCKRNSNEMERNAIVAVFLRKLEYFQGVIFLTTNRKQDFDDAFKSRIHVTISYPSLSNESQSIIWRRLIQTNSKVLLDGDWTDEVYSALGKLNLNGRTIKNILRTAVAYAYADNNALSLRHVVTIIQTEMRETTEEEREKREQAAEGIRNLERLAGFEPSL